MSHRRVLAVLLRLSLVILIPAFCRADDWLPIDPADVKATSEPNAPGADAAILYREETYDDLLHFQAFYFRVKILTEKGKKEWSDVEIPYAKQHLTKVGGVKARTIHSDGTIVPFSGQVFDKMLVKQGDSNVFARVFTLPEVEIGSIVEYKYEIHWDDPWLKAPEWRVQKEVYQRKAVFHYLPYNFDRVSVTVTNSRGEIMDNVSFMPFLPTGFPQPKVTSLPNGHSHIDLTVEKVPALQIEEYMVPPDQLAYRVQFYYTYGNTAAAGVEDFWKQVGKAWNKSVEKFIGHDDRVSAAVAQIVAASDSPEQKARKIYDAVQKFENLSYGRGRTEAENKDDKLPTSAADAIDQKRGYDSDLTRLYVALARAAGLKAYVMRVASRDEYLFQKSVLDENQLGSEVAIVEIDGKDVYLDPGTKFCPYGTIEWKKTTVAGQRQTASGKIEFGSTPNDPYKDNQVKHLADMTLSDSGDIKGKVTVGFFGQQAIRRRQAVLRVDEQQRKKDLEDNVTKWLPEGSTVNLENVWNQDDLQKPLIVRFDVTVPHFASVTGKRLLVPSVLFHTQNTRSFSHPARVQAVYFEYPYLEIDELKLHLPGDLEIEELPKVGMEKRDFCVYVLESSSDKQSMLFHRELAMGDFLIEAKHYEDLKSFFEKVRSGDEQQAILKLASSVQASSDGVK